MTIDFFILSVLLQLSSGSAIEFLNNIGRSVFPEWCGDLWIAPNISGLKSDLNTELYGQPLVKSIVVSLVENHLKPNYSPDKALVLSFHGPPGTGKNFVSDIIIKNIFHLGTKSKFRKFYSGRVDFPTNKLVDNYKAALRKSIPEQARLCDRSVFIFDEVEKIPEGVTDVLKPFLDYYPHLDGVDYRKSIFIFLSNIASHEIYDRILDLYSSGKIRTDFTSRDFEDIIRTASFNEEGGFRYAPLIPHHLIDSYVPFLPLEKEDLKRCIAKEADRLGIHLSLGDTEKILEEVVFKEYSGVFFSTTGCKTIRSKVQVFNSIRRSLPPKIEL